MTPIEQLTQYFRLLTQEQQDNLIYHAEKGTPICCGLEANLFLDGKGAG